MKTTITLELVRDTWHACYDGEFLAKLFAEPKTLLQVLTLKDGPWKDVPDVHRLWVVLHGEIFPKEVFVEFARFCADRAARAADAAAAAGYTANARADYARADADAADRAATRASDASDAHVAAIRASDAAIRASDAARATTTAAVYGVERKVQVEWFLNKLGNQ